MLKVGGRVRRKLMEAEKTPSPEEPKPKLKKGEQPEQWRVLIAGKEIGPVTKEHHAAFAGTPAHDRWKPHRKGSMLDALSGRTYKKGYRPDCCEDTL